MTHLRLYHFNERLTIKNMIIRPKPKQNEETGEYFPNGACSKSELNKSIADADIILI